MIENEIFKKAIESSHMGVLITDYRQPDNPIIYANPYFYKFSGYEPSEVIGKNCRFIQGPQTDRQTVNKIREAISSGTMFSGRILNYCKDKTPFWQNLTISPIFSKEGKVTHFVGLQENITKLVLEEEKTRIEFDKIKTMAKDLKRFATTVAHDLKEPLGRVSGFADLLIENLKNADHVSQEYLKRIHVNSASLNKMIDGLLRHATEEITEDDLTADLNLIVTELAEILNASKKVKIMSPLPKLRVAPYHVREIFYNLLSNSFKYGASKVEVGCYQKEGHWHFFVSDDGPGIPKELHSKVFEFGYSTSGDSKTSGLGLYIVKEYVKKYGGEIWLESLSPKGLTTTFTLVDKDAKL